MLRKSNPLENRMETETREKTHLLPRGFCARENETGRERERA